MNQTIAKNGCGTVPTKDITPETIEDNNSPSRRNSGDAYQQKHGTAEHSGLPITMQNLRSAPGKGNGTQII